ncbi:MAG TPA: TIGR02757 family protein [Chitinophagales bacterium]|nr:TIGR02757 family protein [Chitinophagales bacterium]
MGKAPVSRDFVYELLERKYKAYNNPRFIETDPICIPHLFTKKQDIEIAGFFTATIAWGNRKSIINSGRRIIELMDNAPYQFITGHTDTDLKRFLKFAHRTFNATDALYFIEFFSHYYKQHQSLEDAFAAYLPVKTPHRGEALIGFHDLFFSLDDAPQRTRKHVATPLRKSTCKRINMYLRWMVRHDNKGVDFGIWEKIKPAHLLIPLDVHVDRVARKLGLVKRKQTDWEAVLELTESLRSFDPKDPVKYDFALFGLGVLDKDELEKIY